MNKYLPKQPAISASLSITYRHLLNLTKCFVLLLILISSLNVSGQGNTYYSRTTGNWNVNTTWSTNQNGNPQANQFPKSGDIVYIQKNHTVTINSNAECKTITFNNPAFGLPTAGTIIVSSGSLLTVSEGITLVNLNNADIGANIQGNGTLNTGYLKVGNNTTVSSGTRTHILYSSINTLNIANNLSITSTYRSNRNYSNGYFSHQSGTVTINGKIETTNGNNGNTSTYDLGSLAKLNLTNSSPFALSSSGTNTIKFNQTQATVEYNGIGNQDVYNTTYYNLISSGSGTKTLQGSTTVTNLNIKDGTTFATAQHSITGSNNGSINVSSLSTLSLGSTSSNVNVLFPGGFTSNNINLDNNSTVIYQSRGAQTVSGTPNSYGKLVVAGGNTKTIDRTVRIENSLQLSNTRLATGTGVTNIVLAKNADISVSSGNFNNTQMIVCNGDGSLTKEGTQASDFVMIYPIGTGNDYTPLEVTALTATVNATGSFSARTTNERGVYTNLNDLRRFWTTGVNNLSNISANMQFKYVGADVLGTEDEYLPMFSEGEIWSNALGANSPSTKSFYVTGANKLNGHWTLREPTITYYSYQSGGWDKAETWTTDPSGSLLENPGIPKPVDRVVILNGRTVSISANGKSIFSLQINEGGILNLGTTTGHDFGRAVGQGTIKLASANFPAGDFQEFDKAGGGTVEYNNNSSFTLNKYTYNNLIINLSNPSHTVTIDNETKTNGNLSVSNGTLSISSNTNRDIFIDGNVTVESAGKIQVGSSSGVRRFYVGGDFINNGTVKFSNLPNPDYTNTNNNHVDVVFNNSNKDQYVQCNGITDFYRIEVDKGTDQTYVLNIDASEQANFRLLGRNDQAETGTEPNIKNNKALDIYAGTLRLGNNISIPSLCNGSQSFVIDSDAMLWLDGANVKFSSPTPIGTGTTFLLYGGYKQTGNSSFEDNSKQGFVVRNTGQITIEGGTLSTEVIRTSYQAGVHRGSFTMTGGELTLRATGLPNLEGMGIYGTFTLPYATNAINISGGVINILSPNQTNNGGTQGTNVSILVGADPNNISITGGTINLYVLNGRYSYITSTMPFWNLNIISTSGSYYAAPRAYTQSSNIGAIPVQPVVVLKNLTLSETGKLNTTSGNVDVFVGGDFNISSNATYTPGDNTTFFNGSGAQVFSNSGSINNNLYNMSITNGSELSLAGTATTYIIRKDLEIATGTALRDNNKTIEVSGNIINSGTHIRPAGAAGRITMVGNGAQEITGDGFGQFNNLAISKNGGSLAISSNIRINGAFSIVSNTRVNLGKNKITLGSDGVVYSALNSGQNFNNNKMIYTGGKGSDGGITKIVSHPETILFPYGFYNSSNNTYYYLPSTTQYSDTVSGTINSRPVNERHPLAQGANNALRIYWKNTTTGFNGVKATAFTSRFTYNDFFVTGTENSYFPGVYRYGTAWLYLNDPNAINTLSNVITFANQPTAKGEHTAGYANAFADIPILYSRGNGNWESTNTWSTTGHDGSPASSIPTPSTLVVIGDGNTYNHIVTITQNGAKSGGLKLAVGSTLDLINTSGHNFSSIPEETVTGGGTIVISKSNYFPQGDFGDFIGPNGGTIEYKAEYEAINIPKTSDVTGIELNQYRNLKIRPSKFDVNIPDIDMIIHENLEIFGRPKISSFLYSGGNNNFIVKGDLIVNAGILDIYAYKKNIIIYGDLKVLNLGIVRVRNENGNNTAKLHIYGDIINDGTLDLTSVKGNIETIFKGEKNTVITGTPQGSYKFHKITVDKGTNRDATVTLLSPVEVTTSNPLVELRNGTFRVDCEQANVVITNETLDFTVPHTAALSVLNGQVIIGDGNGNAKLSLAGRLEVLGGTMYIGNPIYNRNNSIEYSAAGSPEIIVGGGLLHVNGQIRRLTSVTSGNLHYKQSGGTTTIYGKARESTRGMFEVDNSGSLFSMSGGTLQFDRPSTTGVTFGDVVLRPDSLNVVGGKIKFGLPTSSSGYDFKMSASAPLWELVVGDENSPQYLTTTVFGVTIKNSLLINQGSEFRAKGLDVTLKGDFFNKNISAAQGVNIGGYQAGTNTQTTIFSGNTQTVTGYSTNLTNFANLLIEPNSSVLFAENTTARINSDLEIKKGMLNDGGNNIYVIGNVVNNSVHSSPSQTGGLVFAGTNSKRVSGNNGVYGNIKLDNTSGVSLLNNATINGKLTFENGILYIDDYQLTFGVNATIAGTLDNTKMIMLNGVLSDQGVRKMFSTGASSFTMPIGVNDKYTPATYNIITNSSPGTITVRPVNRAHPAVADELPNEIKYYWNVDSSGFGSNLLLTHKYQYLDSDVTGSESDFVVGLYRYRDFYWVDLGDNDEPGRVDESENSINVSNVKFVTGDYTAGEQINFTPPLEVYYSRNNRPNNDWTNPSNWSTVGHQDDVEVAIYPPRGNPVIIAEGHTMRLNANAQFQVSVEVNGVLDCGKTLYHNLGTVYGTGKIKLESTNDNSFVFPGGAYDNFFATPGTIVEFTGSNSATLPVKPGNVYKPYNNVILSGTGEKIISADNIKINGSLTITNGTKLNNSQYNKDIYILGNWVNENTSSLSFKSGTGTVIFMGTQPQSLNVKAEERFYNLTMENSAGLTLDGTKGIDIVRTLKLNNGIIYSYVGRELKLSNTSITASLSGVNASSFVDGPVRKQIISGQSFNFPTGSDGRLGRINLMNATSSATQSYWTAQYFNSNPNPTYPTGSGNLTDPLSTISDNEYWVVGRPTQTSSANIQLRWDATSLPSHTGSTESRSLIRVVEFEGGSKNKWTERGQSVSGNATAGTVSTTSPVTQNDYIFTIGAIGVTATINDLTPISICDNDALAEIPVALAGVPPYTLAYRTTGTTTRNFVEEGILTSPYIISLQGADMGGYSPTPYTLELVSVSANGITGFVNPNTVSIEVKITHKPMIIGANVVSTGETREYLTQNNSGSTYTWSWAGNNGGTLTQTENKVSIKFTNTTGIYTLRVVETSSSGCTAYNEMTITIQQMPAPLISPDDANICQGTTETYKTNYNPSNEYYWTVEGGTCTGCGSWITNKAEITVVWNTPGNGSVKVEERIKSSTSIKNSDVLDVIVHKMPMVIGVEGDQICKNTAGTIKVKNSEYGVTYQLMRNDDDSNVGAFVPGTNNNIMLNTGNLTTTTQFYVQAYNLGCETRLPQTGTVDVIVEQPEINLTVDDADLILCQNTQAQFTATDIGTTLVSNYNFYVNNTSVQNSTSKLYSTNALQHKDTILVIGTTSSGCRDTSDMIIVSVGDQIWSGAVSTAWNAVGNWGCPDLPSVTRNALIPETAPRMPVITQNSGVQTIEIENGASITHNGGVFSIAGDIINHGTFTSVGTVELTGTNEQNINNDREFNFSTLRINKSSGTVNLQAPVNISQSLDLSSGIVRTSNTNILTIGNSASTINSNSNSYIDGPLQKIGNTSFVFPVGDGDYWARIAIDDIEGGNNASRMIAQYFDESYPNLDDKALTLNNVSEVEYWDLSNPTNDIKCHVELYSEDVKRSNFNTADLEDLSVAHFESGIWEDHGNSSSILNYDAARIKSGVKLSSFSPITFASKTGSNPLPVELVNFKAYYHNLQTVLTWLTATEHNCSHFDIERSENMVNFVKVGTIYSKAKNGNSTQVIDYRFADNSPAHGTNYYRLKQVDYDGIYSYSKIVYVTTEQEDGIFESISIYPNPTSGIVNIVIPGVDENINISLYNSNGSLLNESKYNPTEPIYDLTHYANGLYIMKISNSENYIIKRIVKQ